MSMFLFKLDEENGNDELVEAEPEPEPGPEPEPEPEPEEGMIEEMNSCSIDLTLMALFFFTAPAKS